MLCGFHTDFKASKSNSRAHVIPPQCEKPLLMSVLESLRSLTLKPRGRDALTANRDFPSFDISVAFSSGTSSESWSQKSFKPPYWRWRSFPRMLKKGKSKGWLGDCDEPDTDNMGRLVRAGLRATQRHAFLDELSNAM